MVELAAALGMTVDACRRYVGQVLEVRHRLPLIWGRVAAGELVWWRAARIAQHTMLLPQAGAAQVDRRLAGVAHKVGVAATEKLCQEALDTFDPDEAEERRAAAAESRRVDVHLDQAGRAGTVDADAVLDTADALDWRPRSPRPPKTSRRRVDRVTGRAPVQGGRGDRPPLPG